MALKDSTVPIDLMELPNNWKYQPLSDLIDRQRGLSYGVVQPGKPTEQGVPIIRVGNIKNGYIETSDVLRVQPDIEEKYKRSRLCGGEVLLTLVGMFLGESAIVPSELRGWNVARAVGVIPVLSSIGSSWVHLCLRSVQIQRYIRIWATTTVQPTLNLRDLANLPIPIPPEKEREAIAYILGSLDDKLELNRSMNETLEEIAQALFKSWFVDFDPVRVLMGEMPEQPPFLVEDDLRKIGFSDRFQDSELGKIPEGWTIKKVGECLLRHTVGRKYDKKTVLPIGKTPVLDQGISGIIGYHNEGPGLFASTDAPQVVFANHTCNTRLITFPFSAIQNVLPFTGKEIDTVWLYYATRDIQSFVEYKGHWPDFVIKKIVVPPSSVACAFTEVLAPFLAKNRASEGESDILTKIRNTLLPKLISGEAQLNKFQGLVP